MEIDEALRESSREPDAEIELPPLPPADSHRSRLRRPHAYAIAATVIAVAAVVPIGLAIQHGRSSDPAPIGSAPRVVGARSSDPLVLAPPGGHSPVRVSESRAMQDVRHPWQLLSVVGGPIYFGLARVTASCCTASDGPAPVPRYRATLAWVGVYQVDTKDGMTSCPAEPPKITRRTPPEFKKYYLAVIVNAHTGRVGIWREDASGLSLRECAGMT